MVAVLQVKKRNDKKDRAVRKRGNAFLKESLPAFCALLLILTVATVATYLITDPLIHPTHHPRLIGFYTYMTHFHPRMCKAATYSLICGAVFCQFSIVFASLYWKYKIRTKGLLWQGELKSRTYLDRPMQKTLPLVLPQAWAAINEIFPGLVVRGGNVHGAHWAVTRKDEGLRELDIELRYVHDPLGIKVWRLYPRRLACTIKLKAKGVSTVAELTYHADSAMDYRSVYEMIDQTNLAVSNVASLCQAV